jgi:hypothetical protein
MFQARGIWLGMLLVLALPSAEAAQWRIGWQRETVRSELLRRGFEIDPGSPVLLELDVHAFKPGSTAARILVGFGAGRGSLIYTARFVSEDGEVLAQIDGKERHTGGEMYGIAENRHAFSSFAGADKTREILLSEAARHIVAVLK